MDVATETFSSKCVTVAKLCFYSAAFTRLNVRHGTRKRARVCLLRRIISVSISAEKTFPAAASLLLQALTEEDKALSFPMKNRV